MSQLQKKVNLEQIEAGVAEKVDLAERLAGIDTSVSDNADAIGALEGRLDTAEGDINALEGRMDTAEADIDALELSSDKLTLALMSTASAPITSPIFKDIESYTVLQEDIVLGNPTVITIPNSKTYKVGKNNMRVLRNGLLQFLGVDYSEASDSTVSFGDGSLKKDDVITFEIGSSTKLDYSAAATYYTEGDHIGKLESLTYSGDIARVVTYTYDVEGRIATEATAEDGVTITRTFAYNVSNQLTGITTAIV